MLQNDFDSVQTDQELRQAQERLDAFLSAKRPRLRYERLRREVPSHPLLVGVTLLSGGGTIGLLTGTALLVASVFSPDFSRMIAGSGTLGLIPPLLVLAALLALCLAGVCYYLALQRGGSSPLMPRDLAESNRLRSEVQRLRASKDVAKRLSATPAPPRGRGFSPAGS